MFNLCFDFLDQNQVNFYCVWPMFRFSQPMCRLTWLKLGMVRSLDLIWVCFDCVWPGFDFIDQNHLVFDCVRPIFRHSRPMFWLSWSKLSMVRISRPSTGMFWICARHKIASRPRNINRTWSTCKVETSKAELGRAGSKHTLSTVEHDRSIPWSWSKFTESVNFWKFVSLTL